jgi:hypothetical protein
MAMFTAFVGTFTQQGANRFYRQAAKWFKDHPDRDSAVTDVCPIRRDHIAEDILKYCAKGVVLPPPIKKKPKKKAAKKKTTAPPVPIKLPTRYCKTNKKTGKKVKLRNVRPNVRKAAKKKAKKS